MQRWRFQIPLEGRRQKTSARGYVERAWPEGTNAQIRHLFEEGKVRADEVIVTRPDRPLASQALVTVEAEEEGAEVFGLPDVEVLLWGQDWVMVDKPVGIPGRLSGDDPMHPIRFMADLLGIDRETAMPVWEMPAGGGGPWLIAKQPDVAARIGDQIQSGELKTTWFAITRRPERSQGQWKTGGGELQFAVTRSADELAELQLTPRWKMGDGGGEKLFSQLLAMTAEAGFPVLGDADCGGYLVAGGLRLRLGAIYGSDDFAHSWPAPRDWWPDEPVVETVRVEQDVEVAAPLRKSIKTLVVSGSAVQRVCEIGHPWVLRDGKTESAAGLDPGDPVELVGPGGPLGVFAIMDQTASVAARVWSRDRRDMEEYREELEIRVDEAIGRRRSFFRQMGSTDAFRVIHGEADGLPGISVDRIGAIWSVVTTGRCARGYRGAVYDILASRDPAAMIIESERLGVASGRGEAKRARLVHQGAAIDEPGDVIVIRDQGILYQIDPFRTPDITEFASQRDNRRRAVERASAGKRWLDLSAPRSGFCLHLAAADAHITRGGANEASRQWLEANFELNQLSPALLQFSGDILSAEVDTDGRCYDGIVLDLETFSCEGVLARCFALLAPEGNMLITRNMRPSNDLLEKKVRDVASASQRSIKELQHAVPSADFPQVDSFPEGAPFEGVWLESSHPETP